MQTHTHMHMHAHMHELKYTLKRFDYIGRHSVCACVCVCAVCYIFSELGFIFCDIDVLIHVARKIYYF